MRRGLNWYKREPVAFIDGVQGMGPDLIGAYAVLVDLFYARGGLSPRDDRHLAGILGCSIRKAASLTDALIARGKVLVRGDCLTQKRAETDAKSSRDVREAQSKGGRDGAEKRWGSNETKDLPMGQPIDDPSLEKRREEKSKREAKASHNKPSPASVLAPLLGDDLARDVVEHRQKIRSPLTARAAAGLLRELEKCPDPVAGAEEMLARGWRGFKAEWMKGGRDVQRFDADAKLDTKLDFARDLDRRRFGTG